MRCVMMVLLMGLLIHVLLMADAHVIARGEWIFGFFEDFFCGSLTLFRLQFSCRVKDSEVSASAIRSEMV